MTDGIARQFCWVAKDHHREAVGEGLTCPGWCWRSSPCWPSWLVLSPARSHGRSAVPHHPEGGGTAGFRVAAWACTSKQPSLLCLTIPSAYCPHWACAEQTSRRWESSQRCLLKEKAWLRSIKLMNRVTVTACPHVLFYFIIKVICCGNYWR